MKKEYTMTGVATGSIMGNVVVGNMPNPTGSAGITNLKSNYSTGTSKLGTALPVMGKVKGVRMVLKPIRKLKKKGSKLMKGGYKL